jgi:branched-chain amino acid transport system permease protein
VNSIEIAMRGTAREKSPKVASALSELPRLLAVLALLGVVIAFFRSDPFVLNILAYAFLFAGVATAWNIIGGFGGQFSLAHGVFFAAGAYLTGNLFIYAQVSPWLSLIPSAALAALIAVAISWPTFRLRGPFFAIATMAFNEVAYVFANHFESLTGGARGLAVPFRVSLANMIFRDRMSYALLMLGFLVVCLIVSIIVYRSRLGYSLQAVRDNEEAARACGIDVTRTKLAGMAVSAALTGIGGAMFMMYVRIADPPTLLTLSEIGVKFALIALIGGVGTIYGPVFGALLIVPLENWLRASISAEIPGAHLIVLGAVLLLAPLFLKRGLVGAGEDLIARVRRARSRS